MSNLYHGLLFLHGHILDPHLLADRSTDGEATVDTLAQARTAASGAATMPLGRSAPDSVCVAC